MGQLFPRYEERPGQIGMAHLIGKAYQENSVALIEAGTGIGKSLAYLAPAIFWALEHKERTVISTHTIALQEQLLEKEIPLILNLLQVDLKAVIVKGMGNYACLKKFDEWEEKDAKWRAWIESTTEGSRSTIPFPHPTATWEKIGADKARCTGAKCSFYRSCFFFKARRRLEEAKLLIVNHHLLMADLKGGEESETLPDYDRLIIDEAHNFEDVALDALSHRFDRISLLRLLMTKIPEGSFELEVEIPAKLRSLITLAEDAFSKLNIKEETTVRLHQPLAPPAHHLFEQLNADLVSLLTELKLIAKKCSEEDSAELYGLTSALDKKVEALTSFLAEETSKSRVRWIEKTASNLTLCESDFNVAAHLRQMVFNPVSTTILCSATLATGKEFEFVKERLGVKGADRAVTEAIYESPFDYPNRVFLGIPNDIPLPQEPDFIKKASLMIRDYLHANHGGAFVLFTSYEMLRQCYELLKDHFDILKQGDAARSLLLEEFKQRKDGILFGTDSFWEGIDVPGEALTLVIITKLPFNVPDDPIVEARSEMLKEEGKNPFMDYLVPEATLKFKQGFGRLMRSKTDRGAVICLDKRIKTKPYGALFLKSLPSCPIYFEPSKELVKRLEKVQTRP